MKTPKGLAKDKIRAGLQQKHQVLDDKISQVDRIRAREDERQRKLMEEEKATYEVLNRFKNNPNGQLHIV